MKLSDRAAYLLAEVMGQLGGEDALKRELSRVSVLLKREKVSPAVLLAVLGGSAQVHDSRPFEDVAAETAAAFEAGYVIATTAKRGAIFS